MIQLTNAILHILDTSSGVTVFSDRELALDDIAVYEYVMKHLEKLQNRSDAKSGVFQSESVFQSKWNAYLKGSLSFRDFSAAVAELAANAEQNCDKTNSFDLLICVYTDNEAIKAAVLKCDNKTGFTHQVENIDGAVYNGIVNQCAILPAPNQRIAEYALVSSDGSILLEDKKGGYNGETKSLLADFILQCDAEISGKETLALVDRITQAVAESFGESAVEASMEASTKTKQFLAEESNRRLQAEEDEEILEACPFTLDPEELSKEIFAENEEMQKEFVSQVKEAGFPKKVELKPKMVAKQVKNQRIKTDTGIELIFPVEFFKNGDFIEFINQPDGTINIQLKHIGYIQNK